MIDLGGLVHDILVEESGALTVDQVTQRVAAKLRDDIKGILNARAKAGTYDTVRGSGPSYCSTYRALPPPPPIRRKL